MYELLLTRRAKQFYEKADSVLVRRVNRCFERLQENPYNYSNIKPLKGLLSGHFRYRLGDWRIIYRVIEKKKQVIILLIVHRKNAYR